MRLSLCLSAIALALAAPSADAATPGTKRVSVRSNGGQANAASHRPVLSQDGRYVGFESLAGNLVSGDGNGSTDVFLRDRGTGRTRRVSVRSNGVEGNQPSFEPDVSADGRYVVFHSEASTLVPGDTNAARDVFLHDRRTGTTRRVSVHSNGGQANSQSTRPAISADGRTVVFESRASNLVAGDSNDEDDVFVHDLVTGRTRLVSVRSNGAQGDTISELPDISGGGRFVVFRSLATNLVGGDSNDAADIFLHDRRTGRTRRISVDSNGAQSDADSEVSAISANGRFIAFDSVATNLVGNDSNGQQDVFVHDRRTGKTRRVSLRSNGAEVSDFSRSPSITANGRFVAFESNATDYVPNDTNGQRDVFLHDRRTATTRRVSVRAGGGQGNHASYEAGLSGDGRWVAFTSQASNLVSSDTNGAPDIFVRGPLR